MAYGMDGYGMEARRLKYPISKLGFYAGFVSFFLCSFWFYFLSYFFSFCVRIDSPKELLNTLIIY